MEFPVEVRRGGEIVTLTLRPAAVESGGQSIGRIGAALHRDAMPNEDDWYVTERRLPLDAAGRAVARTWEITSLTVGLLWKMVRLELSSEHLSGPITIARYARDSASGGFTRFLEFLALVSVSLGILNLLPIPSSTGTPAHSPRGGGEGRAPVRAHDDARPPGGARPARWPDGPCSLQ